MCFFLSPSLSFLCLFLSLFLILFCFFFSFSFCFFFFFFRILNLYGTSSCSIFNHCRHLWLLHLTSYTNADKRLTQQQTIRKSAVHAHQYKFMSVEVSHHTSGLILKNLQFCFHAHCIIASDCIMYRALCFLAGSIAVVIINNPTGISRVTDRNSLNR